VSEESSQLRGMLMDMPGNKLMSEQIWFIAFISPGLILNFKAIPNNVSSA